MIATALQASQDPSIAFFSVVVCLFICYADTNINAMVSSLVSSVHSSPLRHHTIIPMPWQVIAVAPNVSAT
jgi:hypothetical protein